MTSKFEIIVYLYIVDYIHRERLLYNCAENLFNIIRQYCTIEHYS